jgi:hypothetical protein
MTNKIYHHSKQCVQVWSACMSVHYVHAVPAVARRGPQILWDWRSGRLRISTPVLRLNLGPLQEQRELLTAYSSLQFSILCFAKLRAKALESFSGPALSLLQPQKTQIQKRKPWQRLGNSSLQETYDRKVLRVGTLDKWILCPAHKPCVELYDHLYLHSSSHWSPKPGKQRPTPSLSSPPLPLSPEVPLLTLVWKAKIPLVSRATTVQLGATSSLTPSSKYTHGPHPSRLGMTFPACVLPAWSLRPGLTSTQQLLN